MASISWTDTEGSATLDNSKPNEGGRFRNWTPKSVPFGDTDYRTSNGQKDTFRYRTDHSAYFEIPGIPNTDQDLMLRLQFHLENGGQVSVATDDAGSRTYATCCLAEGSNVEIEFSDNTFLEYTVRMTLLNVAGSPVRMECIYS